MKSPDRLHYVGGESTHVTFTESTVRSFAKINWSLRVLRRRSDGFHDIETVLQTISLCDELTFRRADRLTLTCSDPRIPVDESNLVLRAWRMVARHRSVPPIAIHIEKRIPSGGGLGGGSSNAATTLLALDRLFDLKLDRGQMHEMAARLGSDVPFFLSGGTAFATGRGEKIESLPHVGEVPLLLVFPDVSMSTAEAYGSLRRSDTARVEQESRGEWATRIESGLLQMPELLVNDFEEPFFEKFPAYRDVEARLIDHGASKAMLCGSGSTIFGAFRSRGARDRAADALDLPWKATSVETIPRDEAVGRGLPGS